MKINIFIICNILILCSCCYNLDKDTENMKKRDKLDIQKNIDLVNRIVIYQDSLSYYLQKTPENMKFHSDYENENGYWFQKLKKYLKDYFSNGYEIISNKFSPDLTTLKYSNINDILQHHQYIVIKSKIKNKKLEFHFIYEEKYNWFLNGIQ